MRIFKRKKDESKESQSNEHLTMDDDEDEYDECDTLGVDDAADIWASNGKDEDYTFGYSEEELEDALNRY